MSDTLTIVGTCGEISERNGWHAFAINVPGKQYPIKLSTKVDAIIQQARAVGDQVATWTYKESEGGDNPNKPGTKFTNRYLESVVAGASPEAQAASDAPTPTAGSSPQSSTHPALPAGDRERSIIRQTCIKAACELYGGQTNRPPDPDDENAIDWPLAVMGAADRFERWIMRDLVEPPF